jgi:hypothetical protein
MTEASHPEIAHARRAVRSWRVAFLAYVIAMEIATHWPRLDLGESGPSDKTIHLVAFGILTALLWRAQWLVQLGAVVFIALIWSGYNEISQGMLPIGRTSAWQDFIANVLGVALAGAWIWALKPVGGTGNRLRLARQRFVIDEIFADWTAWAILIGVTIGCAVPLILLWPLLRPLGIEGPLVFTVLVWLLVLGLFWMDLWRRRHDEAIRRKACFTCGASCRDVRLDELGRGACGICASPISAGQWVEYPRPSMRVLVRLGVLPALVGIAIIAAGFGLIALTVELYDRLMAAGALPAGAPRLARIIGQERKLMQAVDIAAVFMTFALVTRLFRGRLARHFDQPYTCRKCGHDLRGTPTTGGMGRCGECGFEFARSPGAPDNAA